ncbi:DNA topoisomerase IV, alpha subunit [Rhizoclosmatium globosum]|uniref:DNA topoisomerase (ATP-hydrolyzing) n=1 Tax=Rhizoclosmatium globosum TaxID=329046 RepID=A0A1Y2CSH1_9FUNG|nr:DNA topoisomerase IV, alpha subunit [Rhizoclosmatium globosum]|eukprot:ORY49952.1 DNA topoisomerase IV, alpha subunit [Rhizoclosmatium globosum]
MFSDFSISDSDSESSLESIGSVEANETDDSEGEQTLDALLLDASVSATATHIRLGRHHAALSFAQSHLAPQLRESMLAVVRVGAAPAENIGDLISVAHKQPAVLCRAMEAVLGEVRAVTKSLKHPVLALVAKDDSVWSYNPLSHRTTLKCNPSKVWRMVKSDSARFDQIMKCLEITLDLLKRNKTAAKRDIFYRNVGLFKRQSNVDDIVESIACSFNVPRHSLNIFASAKGLVKGPLLLTLKNNSVISCNDRVSSGILIPLVSDIIKMEYRPFPTSVATRIRVLLVEKDASFTGIIGELNRIHKDQGEKLNSGERFQKNWILVTGKGYPDKNTHAFINLLSRAQFSQSMLTGGLDERNALVSWIWTSPNSTMQLEVLPPDSDFVPMDIDDIDYDDEDDFDEEHDSWFSAAVPSTPSSTSGPTAPSTAYTPIIYGLFDCDPHGVEILLCYMFGSQKNAYESPHLATPSIIPLGLFPSDLNVYVGEIRSNSASLIPMTLKDRKKCLAVIKRCVFKSVKFVRKELQRLLWMGVKVEIQGVPVEFLVTTLLVEKMLLVEQA